MELLRAMLEERKQRDEEEVKRREQERREREEESRRAEAQRELERQEREEEKRRVEAKKDQERQRRMEESQLKDETDRRLQEDKWEQRVKELCIQMEMLTKLAETKKAESFESSRAGENELRAQSSRRDDIEAYTSQLLKG